MKQKTNKLVSVTIHKGFTTYGYDEAIAQQKIELDMYCGWAGRRQPLRSRIDEEIFAEIYHEEFEG